MRQSIDRFVDWCGMNPFTKKQERFVRWDYLFVPKDDMGQVLLRCRKAGAGDESAPISRFGGRPLLPRGTRWPKGPNGLLTFVGQLNFAELRAEHRGSLALPERGVLGFFYDIEQPVFGSERGDRKSFRLIYVRDPSKARTVESEDLDPIPVRRLALDYQATRVKRKGTDHRVGGGPQWLQGDERATMDLQAAKIGDTLDELRAAERRGVDVVGLARRAADWRLVWQIDSDDDLGLTWFDEGRLFILARRNALRKGDFETAVCIVQSH